MRGVKFAVGLVVALVIHLLGARAFGSFSLAVDLFLVLTLFNAVDGNLAGGMLGGLVAGLTSDAVTGGLYGLHGFADTIIGYGTAFASQRLVIQSVPGITLLFSLGAAIQQATTMGLMVLLLQETAFPELVWIGLKIALVGLVGLVGFMVKTRGRDRLAAWRQGRKTRLR
jgi:rod shape-determining protein MreD